MARFEKATRTHADLSRDEHLHYNSLGSCPQPSGALPEAAGPRPMPPVEPDITGGFTHSVEGLDDRTERMNDMAGRGKKPPQRREGRSGYSGR